MNVYKEIFDIILKREYALLGRVQTQKMFADLAITVDETGNLAEEGPYTAENLEKLINILKQNIGYIAILVIRLPIRRKLIQNNLNMPIALI